MSTATAKRVAVKKPVNHLRAVTAADMPSNVSRIDGQIATMEQQLANLKRQRRIEEFSADPDAYDKRLLSGAAPDVQFKDHPLKKPAGSHRSLVTLIMEIFQDYPTSLFTCGTIMSKLEDRGWKTRARTKTQMIHTSLANLVHKGKIERINYGVYKLHQD